MPVTMATRASTRPGRMPWRVGIPNCKSDTKTQLLTQPSVWVLFHTRTERNWRDLFLQIHLKSKDSLFELELCFNWELKAENKTFHKYLIGIGWEIAIDSSTTVTIVTQPQNLTSYSMTWVTQLFVSAKLNVKKWLTWYKHMTSTAHLQQKQQFYSSHCNSMGTHYYTWSKSTKNAEHFCRLKTFTDS